MYRNEMLELLIKKNIREGKLLIKTEVGEPEVFPVLFIPTTGNDVDDQDQFRIISNTYRVNESEDTTYAYEKFRSYSPFLVNSKKPPVILIYKVNTSTNRITMKVHSDTFEVKDICKKFSSSRKDSFSLTCEQFAFLLNTSTQVKIINN